MIPALNFPHLDNSTRQLQSGDSGEATCARQAPKIDWTDPIFLRAGWENDPIVIEGHRLIFFHVSKCASTELMRLFRRMMGYSDWSRRDDHKLHDPSKNGLRYLGHYSREEQEEFMTSEEWTRAVFVRDPVQRLVSAYREKALGGFDGRSKGSYVKERWCRGRRGERRG